MRKLIAITMVAALGVLSACGDDDGDDTAQTTDTTQEVTTATEGTETTEGATDDVATPMEVIDEMDAAAASGDWEAFAAMWSDDAVFVTPDGTAIPVWEQVPVGGDDFDGDGVPTMMDAVGTELALNDTFERTVESDCSELPDGAVSCYQVESDVFSTAAGVEDPGMSYRNIVEDGLLVRRELVGPSGGNWAAVERFDDAVLDEQARYERWVEDNHPDMYAAMFHDPCCLFRIVNTQESVEHHEMLMPEYQQTLNS